MAERKSGPVKPPVVDLTARPADPLPAAPVPPEAPENVETPAPSAAALPEAPPKPAPEAEATAAPKPVKPASPASPASTGAPKSPDSPSPRVKRPNAIVPALAGAAGGAVVAVIICYGLAAAGYWPGASADAGRLDALQQRLAATEAAVTANTTAQQATESGLAALAADVGGKLTATAASLAAMQQALAQPQTPEVDLAPLTGEVKTLTSRLDAVAAGASSADAGALAANIATLQQNLTSLTERAAATDTTVGALKTELGAAKAAIDKAAAAPTPQAIATAMQLPLLISALDADMTAGKPYAADLEALVAAAPATRVPANISQFAATGLPAPQQFVAAFAARMPDLMATLPASTDDSWQATAGDLVRNLLALRPQGEQPGDSPAAVLSRLEAAVNRRDFAGAATLLAQLPPPMQQALGDSAAQLRALADADGFIAELRRTALTSAEAQP